MGAMSRVSPAETACKGALGPQVTVLGTGQEPGEQAQLQASLP